MAVTACLSCCQFAILTFFLSIILRFFPGRRRCELEDGYTDPADVTWGFTCFKFNETTRHGRAQPGFKIISSSLSVPWVSAHPWLVRPRQYISASHGHFFELPPRFSGSDPREVILFRPFRHNETRLMVHGTGRFNIDYGDIVRLRIVFGKDV